MKLLYYAGNRVTVTVLEQDGLLRISENLSYPLPGQHLLLLQLRRCNTSKCTTLLLIESLQHSRHLSQDRAAVGLVPDPAASGMKD